MKARNLKAYFFCLLFITLFYSSSIHSQEVLLEKSVEDSISIPEKGPNSKKYNHFYFGLANYVPFNQQGIDIKPLGSVNTEIGWRHKRKLNNTFSAGYAFSFSRGDINLKQDTLNVFPTNNIYKKEMIRLNSFNLELYQRFNFGKRGNYMGIFMDIGVKGRINFLNKYITVDRLASNPLGKKVKSVYSQPSYINLFDYGLIFRAGVNNVILFCSYALADIVDQEKYTEDLDGIWIGLQVGLHR